MLSDKEIRLLEAGWDRVLENLEWIMQCRPQGTTAGSVSRGVPWCLTESHYHCDLKCSPGQYVGFFKVFPTLDTPIPPSSAIYCSCLLWHGEFSTSLSLVLAVSDGCVSEEQNQGRVPDVGLPGPRGPWRDQGSRNHVAPGSPGLHCTQQKWSFS